MTVLSYLRKVANEAFLNGSEKDSIDKSISTLESRLKSYYGSNISENFRFGSSTRGTILPRSMDANSDIDYMVVFSNDEYKPNTYLNNLKRFVKTYYGRSEIYQSSPTIVLELSHIKFELVPAIDDYWSAYKIPAKASDYSDWTATDPNDFNESLTSANKSNKNLIKPLVRVVKYWNSQNGYVFDSYDLEKELVDKFYFLCYDLKDYFYSAMSSLELGYFDAQWKKDKLTRAKDIIRRTKQYEADDMPYTAEDEIKKLIPPT